MAEKISDVKLKKAAAAALNSIVCATSFQFVLSQLYPSINSLKNPKALCELFLWIKDSIIENGVKDLDMKSLVDSLKKGFSNSTQAVRSAAVSAFGILNSLSKKGTANSVKIKDLLALVDDSSPQIIQMLMIECETAKHSTSFKAIKDEKQTKSQSAEIEDLECQDISSNITTELIEVYLKLTIKNMNDSNWKIRKAALDDLLNILKGIQSQIKPNLGICFIDLNLRE